MSLAPEQPRTGRHPQPRLARFPYASWLPLQDDGENVLVGRADAFPVAGLLRDAKRRRVVRMNETNGTRRPKARRAPVDNGADGFGSEALAVRGWCQHPADFRHAD